MLQAGRARLEPGRGSWRARAAAVAWAAAVCLVGASACDNLLGDVEIETARLSPDPDGVAPGVVDPGNTEQPVSIDAGPRPVCELESRRCVEGRLERCNDERSGWAVIDQCATPELCELTRETGSPICEAPRCEPEERRCRAETLTVCNPGLTGFDDETACAAAVFCDPESGSCLTRSCEAGERRCNGAQIEVCNRDGDAFEPIGSPPCASAALCTRTGDGNVSCRDAVCAGGDFRCVGNLLQRCSTGRDAWEDVRTCSALELCDDSLGLAGCRPAACQAGERRCSDGALQQCRPSRDGFDVIANCGAAGCDAAARECRDPCLVGVRRCAGADVEACESPLTGWEVIATCATNAVCDVTVASGCREAACPNNARRCRGANLERCNAQRSGFELVEVCATAELCVQNGSNNARCEAPVCDAGERECRGGDLAICNAGRTGFDEVACGLLGCNANADPPNCRGL